MTEMTMKTFMTAVLNTKGITPEMETFAKAEIAKIEGKNAKRRATPTAAQKANAEMLTAFLAVLSETETITASTAAVRMGVTVQKASALLQSGVKSGALTVSEVKVKGKGTVKAYTKAVAPIEDVPTE